MNSKRKHFAALALLLLTGCTTVYLPNGQGYHTMPSKHVVVNNTGYLLNLTVDGVPVTTLGNGQSLALQQHFLIPSTQASVVAFDAEGNYVGAANYTFHASTADTWQINQVDRPRESR
jgi:hypothetical protein